MEKESLRDRMARVLFSTEDKPVAVDFSEMKTKDGVILNITAVEKDGIVEVVSEDGKELAAEGEYLMEDGVTIVVGAEGMILEVKPVEEEEEKEDEKEEVAMEESGLDAFEERIASIESLLESKFKSVVEAFTAVLEEKELEVKELNEKFEAFAKAPAEKEVEVKKLSSKAQAFLDLGQIRRK